MSVDLKNRIEGDNVARGSVTSEFVAKSAKER
jgi:hypothetical protein